MENRDDLQPDDGQWEYKDITIPLNLRERLTDKKIRPQVERIISEHLDEEKRQGWQPDEPVDVSSLRTRERIQFRFHWFSGPHYISATIRLKRPIGGS